MNFKSWLKLTEVGTMSSAPTGGVGDIAPFKAPVGWGIVRRNWPEIDPFFAQNSRKKTKKGITTNENNQNLDTKSISQQFLSSDVGKKHQNSDCKTVTRSFIQWAQSKGLQAQALHLAPPSAEFVQKNPQFRGKGGTGDSHIMPVVAGAAIDFTARQFGLPNGYNDPLITPINQVQSVYGKFGYFTDKPEWFDGGKSHYLGSWDSITTIDRNFKDENL